MPRVEAEGAKERRKLAGAQTLQEGMDCREKGIIGAEGAEEMSKRRRACMDCRKGHIHRQELERKEQSLGGN